MELVLQAAQLIGLFLTCGTNIWLSNVATHDMKVLIVSPVPTDPIIAGNRSRVAALFTALVGLGYEVTFAYVPYETADYEQMRTRLGDRFHVLQAKPPPFPNFARRLERKIGRIFDLKSAHSWKVDEWFDESLIPQILQLHAKESFESILIEYVFLSKLAAHLSPSVRTIIDTHDLMGDRHKRYLDAGMTPTWFATTRSEEISALNRAKAVLAIQQEEADYLRQSVSAEVFCVGHLLNFDIRPVPDPGGSRILFVGSANPINAHALEWFLYSVFPRIQREVPNSELAVVGEVGHARGWPGHVLLLGKQHSLADTFSQATIVINPVQFGTGLPVKTVEALGYGKPVVATPAGVRGLETHFHQAVALAESPTAFAERVVELLKSKQARSVMALHAISAAREWQQHQLTMLNCAVTGQPVPRQVEGNVPPKMPTISIGSAQKTNQSECA